MFQIPCQSVSSDFVSFITKLSMKVIPFKETFLRFYDACTYLERNNGPFYLTSTKCPLLHRFGHVEYSIFILIFSTVPA